MKAQQIEDVWYVQCDGSMCGKVAGMSHDKKQATADAQEKAEHEAWLVKGDLLYCPTCRYLYEEVHTR